jgi:putative sigma-54 modulation protein
LWAAFQQNPVARINFWAKALELRRILKKLSVPATIAANGRREPVPPDSRYPANVSARGVEPVQVKISARHGHLAEDTQQFIRQKAEKLLRYFERLTQIEVTVDLRNDLQKKVEFLVSAEHKHDFVAQETNNDILAAVDLVVDKLERQISRYKEKIQDHRRRPSMGEVTGAPSPEDTNEE